MFKLYSPECDKYVLIGVGGVIFAFLLNMLMNGVLPKGHTFIYILIFPMSNLFYELFPAWSSDWYYFLNSFQYALYFAAGGILLKNSERRTFLYAAILLVMIFHTVSLYVLLFTDKSFLRDISWRINSFFPESFLYL